MNMYQAKAIALLNVTTRHVRAEALEKKQDAMRASFITSNEIEEIMMGAVRRREATEGPRLTDVELQEIVNTVISDRFAASCSELAGLGLVDVNYDPAKPEGNRITYCWRDDLTQEEYALLDRITREQKAKLDKVAKAA